MTSEPNGKIITLTQVYSVTCYGCDGATVWLSADYTPTGDLLRLYCCDCGQDVRPGKATGRELQAKFETWKRKETERKVK